jgi:hypothetical protein
MRQAPEHPYAVPADSLGQQGKKSFVEVETTATVLWEEAR